ncbi:uncharacterized protein LOC131619781 [Vicia villosa]|uniref:uncharacterized protein LOC131619781 n=1 Tax=Vicia villosa TaxID=3911 RepID=UPI00273B54A6|nr:uncharacterized protein LOC131619781 [Vicia villosa]
MRKMFSYREELESNNYWQTSVQIGSYKTKHMYKELRGEKPNVPWYKIFYQNAARPRAKFILWIALWDRLPTKSRLTRFGIITDGNCAFCGKEETQEHLLFECEITGKIWKTMLNWIGMDRIPHGWRNEKAWICMETMRKGWRRLLLKVVLAETVYAIWTLRNDIIFNNQTMDEDLHHKIKVNVATRCSVFNKLSNHINLGGPSIC